MPPRTYAPIKLGTQPYNPVKVSGRSLQVGDIIWLPNQAPTTGVVHARKIKPNGVAQWSRATVVELNLGGPNGLLLSWV